MHRKPFCCDATESFVVYAIDRKNKRDTARVSLLFLWWSIFNESRTVITNHARGVYIIKTEFCISPTQRVVYHQVAGDTR